MLLTIFLSFQHWVQLYSTVHIWQGGEGIDEDVQRKIPLKHHCCETGFSELVHSKIPSCNNAVSQSKPFLYSSSCSSQMNGSLLSDYSGVWTASFLLNKGNWSGLRGLLCLCGSWVGGWGGEQTEWSLTSARATSTLTWVTQLPISPVLPCSQISPCGLSLQEWAPVIARCWILASELWVIWFCYEYYGFLGRVKSRRPAPTFYHFWIRFPLLLARLYHYKWEKKPPYRLHFCSLPRRDFSWCLWRWNCCN